MQFSIVTACYRGTRTLARTYQSLVNLNTPGVKFEWILIDDYSNDDGKTEALIRSLQEQAPFPTKSKFLDANHYGAKSAYEGAKLATGDYLIILDQDDLLTPDALVIFKGLIEKYKTESNFAGVCGRCSDMSGRLIGTPSPWTEKISNELEIRHHYKIRGEMFQCTKRELIEEYFSDFKPGYTNGYVWTRIARKYRYLYTSALVRVYDNQNPQSMTHAPKLKYLTENIFQYGYYLNKNIDYLKADPLFLGRYLLQYIRLGMHEGLVFSEVLRSLVAELRYSAIALYPFAYLRTLIDRKKGRI